ncbi:hypothetical protein KVR01_006164 [Diaporthe batatas]|uniref:uncharacterized protein n=1 Tax=Diaporthe batatas TaxID=748121 RepID=UPI001D042B52|nr:uncharacterized protein KVR01_006164 [Diaporthe batatas]KAG8164246.1 hypothetical protein KVR01_006164 [Diaporthe batatas]
MPLKRGRRPDFFRHLYDETPIKQPELPWPTDFDSESGMLIDVWDDDKKKFVRRLQVVGEYPHPPPREGTILSLPEFLKKTLVVLELGEEHERVHPEPMCVVDTLRWTPSEFINRLRNQYSLGSSAMTITVDNTQPVLLDAIRELPDIRPQSHSMRKKPCEPPKWHPEVTLELATTDFLDTGELPESPWARYVVGKFKRRCKKMRVAADARPRAENPEDDWDHFFDDLEWLLPADTKTQTRGHSFFEAFNKGGESVGMLWFQLSKDKSWSQCHYIEVKAEHRRKGYGAKIVSFWQKMALMQGVDVMLVDIIGGNAGAEGLFAGMGFTTVEKTVGIRPPQEPNVGE